LGDLASRGRNALDEDRIAGGVDNAISGQPSAAHAHAEGVLTLVDHQFWKVRREVCLSLGKMSAHLNDEKYIVGVVRRLEDSDPGVREGAVEAILMWRTDVALAYMDQIASGLHHENVGVRLSCVSVLDWWTRQGYNTMPHAADVARQLGSDVDVRLLSAALECLEGMGPDAFTPYVESAVELLEHRVPQIIFLALRLLSRAGAAAAPFCERIAPLLESDGSGIRMLAISALGCFGHDSATYAARIADIKACDYSTAVRQAAEQALEQLRASGISPSDHVRPKMSDAKNVVVVPSEEATCPDDVFC